MTGRKWKDITNYKLNNPLNKGINIFYIISKNVPILLVSSASTGTNSWNGEKSPTFSSPGLKALSAQKC
jgi:hypothetical protein